VYGYGPPKPCGVTSEGNRRNVADIDLLEPIDADEAAGFANVSSSK
jgi:hypothetical protein